MLTTCVFVVTVMYCSVILCNIVCLRVCLFVVAGVSCVFGFSDCSFLRSLCLFFGRVVFFFFVLFDVFGLLVWFVWCFLLICCRAFVVEVCEIL